MAIFKQLTSITRRGQSVKPRTHLQPLTQSLNQTRRPFHSSPITLKTDEHAKEEARFHDRDILDPRRSETSNTGTDDEVAGHPSAYDPKKTSPESELAASEEETKQEGKISNPLNVSPANTGVSGTRPSQEGLPDRNAEKSGSSGRGVARKNREVNKPRK
ncbi:hypothetical protein BDV29DRAFT_87553 [Aspergillus leporis]|uniref:Uncharacterized protein n=1 Tax=Aspergillus leporis TaxID=41062 RepID=A0A5N5X6K4_9EURO|nr:hypothetical protein BDV29DRAFT_87553 [Aspergillus leporis]